MTNVANGLLRADAVEKVTGAAKYTGDLHVAPDTLHVAVVMSTIASGRVLTYDDREAKRVPGFVKLMGIHDAPRLVETPLYLSLLQNEKVHHAGQPVALVFGKTMKAARAAAHVVRVQYERSAHQTSLDSQRDTAYLPRAILGQPPQSRRGDPEMVFRNSKVQVTSEYETPLNVHQPMEPHIATVEWRGSSVMVCTATSGIFTAREILSKALEVPEASITVVMRYQGGGFGGKGRAWWPLLTLVVAASRMLGRPLRYEMSREDMFTAVACRQSTRQKMQLSATADGKLTSIQHDAVCDTATFADFSDSTCFATCSVYQCADVAVSQRLVKLNIAHPCPMRAPGEGPGSFALESALDELAERLDLDPVELRLRNIGPIDEHTGRPWSSNSMAKCLEEAVRSFGWKNRPRASRVTREGDWLIGTGVAGAYYPTFQAPAEATVRLYADGSAEVSCGFQDIGTGSLTAMAQVAATELGLNPTLVVVRLGDTRLPRAPMAAGSQGTLSVVPAIEEASRALKAKLIAAMTRDAASPLEGTPPSDVTWISAAEVRARDGRQDSPFSAMSRSGQASVEASASSAPPKDPKYSAHCFGACMAEVRVNERTGELRVTRLLGAYASGRIINSTLARSQYVGGLVWGVGMALHEKLNLHAELGLPENRSLTDYLVPVQADIPSIEVLMIEETDVDLPGGGIKGVGMVGTVGTAAAIANAAYHATGRRFRKLPIFPQELLVDELT